MRAVAARFQWQFDYLDADGDDPVHPGAAGGRGRGPGPAGRRARPHHPAQPGREPRLLRPQVPVQAGRDPGQGEHLRLHRRGAGHVPRPVRRALRHLPRLHAVRGARAAQGGVRGLAGQLDREGRARRPRRCPPARPPARWSRPPPRTSRSPRRTLSAAANAPFTIHFKNEDAPACRTTSRSRTPRAPRSSRATSSTAARRSTTPSGALAAGAYTFVCTVHPNMTGTLTVQ